MNGADLLFERKNHIVGYFEEHCATIELTPKQLDRIRTSYQAVGDHLADCTALEDFSPRIFAQGSVSLGTTVRPIHLEQHFDVDLVCKLEAGHRGRDQSQIHGLVGNALREHDVYREILTILKRGWRLEYAESSRFHLDVTPAVPNFGCSQLSVFVPDKERKRWQASNPEGYATWFAKNAQIQPRLGQKLLVLANSARAGKVDPLPGQIVLKNALQRIVQLLKRHRDVVFEEQPDRAPISVILTTLAAKSYAHAALAREYETEFDLLREVVAGMPGYIKSTLLQHGGVYYEIPNETVAGENFAEKWNKSPDLASAFYEWHREALGWMDRLLAADGRDSVQREFRAHLGGRDSDTTFRRVDERIAAHRNSRSLLYGGSTIGLNVASGLTVRRNNFFGA